jgi:hypothetical protein
LGASSNLQNQQRLFKLCRIRAKALARDSQVSSKRALRRRQLPILACVLGVLQEHGGRMHIAEIHEQVEARLKTTLPRQSLKDCLSTYSAGERPRIKRVRRGWYQCRR